METLEANFGGRLGKTVDESTAWWPPRVSSAPRAPNVLQVIFDDTGWSDFGCFGSDIETPFIDALAAGGLRYTNFHVTPLCSPTRACLMTGRNHHRVGMRFLADIDTGFPNSRGRIDPELPMVPAQLQQAGYGTYLIGKWHLAPQHEITPAGPFRHWPLARGFDRFFGFLDGCTDQFSPELFEDNHFLRHGMGAEHLNTELADRAMQILADHALYRPNDPFYMTFAPGATHAPLQAPRALIDKYVPIFEGGWDLARERRLGRQIAEGLVPAGTELTPRNPGVRAWDDLTADEKRLYVRQQAAFAAFLEHTDTEIGRILSHLEKLGMREDTMVLVMADNGASREGGVNGAVDINGPYSGRPEGLVAQLARIDDIGGPDGPAHYPEGWAMAGNTPFRRYKQSVELGGVRSPLIVNWPRGIADQGGVRTQFAHAIDIAATVMDAAGVYSRVAMDGGSLRNSFASAKAPAPRTTQYWEMFGHRAIWQDGWKAVAEHLRGADYGDDVWRLHDTRADFAENVDVSGDHPDMLAELIATWWREAERNQVLPLDDRTLVQLLNETKTPYQLANRRQLVLVPENSHVPVPTGVAAAGRDLRVTARLRGRRAGEGGIILVSGARQGGYAIYVDGDALVFEHMALGQRARFSGAIPAGDALVQLEVRHGDSGANAILSLGDRVVSEGSLPMAISHPSFWGLDVGAAAATAFSQAYAEIGRFSDGVLDTVTLTFLEEMTSEDLAELIAQGE